MMRAVASEFITLDGVFEGPGGVEGFAHGGWASRYERGAEGGRFKLDEILQPTPSSWEGSPRSVRRGMAVPKG